MVIRKCRECGKEFKTHQSQINRGGGKFCSISCATTYRNKHDNPAKKPEVKLKISKNHADVSGANNPMYGVKGKDAPNFIDGRSKFRGRISRKIGLANLKHECAICGNKDINDLHVHHLNGNHSDNDISNLIMLCIKCHMSYAHHYIRDEEGKYKGSILNTDLKECEYV